MRCAIGIDFGTMSGRAVLVDLATGAELSAAVHEFANGVIERHLPAPDSDVRLEPDWALQDPADYIATIQATVPRLLAETGIEAADVVGLGIDFTPCTMLPTTSTARRSARLREFRRDPHAWVKLWKHHAAQPEADRINATAAARGEPWLPRYGGRISSEWFYSKSLQILDEAPNVYRAADRLIEAADWVVWRLTGVETRNSCTAGYKAIWSKQEGFPDPSYFGELDPAFAAVVDDKMSRDDPSDRRPSPAACPAEAAAWTGLRPGTPVAIANVDAHVSVPAVGVTEPGTMVAVMGTSTCHLVLGSRLALAEGMCGVVEDGIIPGLFGYEAGQSAVGDIFAWFTAQAVPPDVHERARRDGLTVHAILERDAARLRPGRIGPAGARLVERQSVDPRRRRAQRAARRGDARDATGRHLSGAARVDGIRHAGDHRVARGSRRRGRTGRCVWRAARAERAAHAALGGHHRDASSTSPRRARRRRSVRRCTARSRRARLPAASTRSPTRRRRWSSRTAGPTDRTPTAAAVYDELFADYMTPPRPLRSGRR